jgi:hypothetical protein
MEIDEATAESIRRYARGALANAEALGVVPVPIDQVAAALQFADPAHLYDLGGLAPGLKERIAQLKDKVLGALDVREHVIYLDRDQPVARQRFHHSHELGHHVLPWHRDAYFGDDRFTLDPDTLDELESEATTFGVELVFGIDAFRDQAASYRLGLAAPLELAEAWRLSRTATIRRYAQSNPRACALLVIGRRVGVRRVKVLHIFQSPSFGPKYGTLKNQLPEWLDADESDLGRLAFELLTDGTAEPVSSGQFQVPDGPLLEFELTSNGYRLFALLFEGSRLAIGRRVKPLWTPARAIT